MKKIIDEKGRVFGRISIIDFIVIAIVLVLGIALYIKFNVLEVTSNSAETTKITYELKISGIRDFTIESIQAGDILFDLTNDNGNSIGTIVSVVSEPAQAACERIDGTYIIGNVEGRYDLTLTIEANGLANSGRYFINKTYEINANSIRLFYTKYCTFSATIMEIH